MLIINANEEAKSYLARLPSAYKEVEYIESNGNQYLDSLYNPNYNTKIACKFAHNEHTIDTPVFGTRGYNSANQYTLWSHPTEYGTSTGVSQCLFNSLQQNLVNYAQGTIIEFEYSKTGGKYHNTTFTRSPSSGTCNYSMIIFGLRTQNNIDNRKFSGKMYYFKIYDNNNLVRDLVPCYRKSDNVVGMYDLVNDVFYTNQGSGSFTK